MGKTKPGHSKHEDERTPALLRKEAGLNVYLLDTAWRVAVPLLGLSLAGIWLDNRYKTDPLFSLIGLFLGIALAVLAMYRLLATHFPETLDMIKGNDPKDDH